MSARSSLAAVGGVGAVVLLAITACTASSTVPGGSPATSPSAVTSAPEHRVVAVDGLTVEAVGGSSMSAAIPGTVSVDDRGCWVLTIPGTGRFDVIWPAGTTWDGTDRRAVRLTTGTVVATGSSIRAGGGFYEGMPRSELSIAPDVACLGSPTVTAVSMGDPASISVAPR